MPERLKQVGDLSGTILLALNMLDRIATRIQKVETGEIDGFEDAESIIERDGVIVNEQGQMVGGQVKTRRVRRRESLNALYDIYNRYLARVRGLQRTWQEMQIASGGAAGMGFGSPEEAVQAFQAAQHAIEEKTGHKRIPAEDE